MTTESLLSAEAKSSVPARLAVRLDAAGDCERGPYIEGDNLTVAQAGDVGLVIAGKNNSVRKFTTGNAFLRGVGFAGTQVKFGNHPAFIQIEERDRIILIVGGE